MLNKDAIDTLECVKSSLTKFNHPVEELMLKDILEGKEAGGSAYYYQKELLLKYEAKGAVAKILSQPSSGCLLVVKRICLVLRLT